MTEYRTPKPTGYDKESVYRLAEAIASQIKYAPGDSLVEMVEKLGGKLSYRDFWQTGVDDSDSTLVRSEGDFDIVLSTNTSQERDNFTIAHELGHYFLHYLIPQRESPDNREFRANRYGSDRTEWEANWFAAALLMPEEQFRSDISTANGNIATVAKNYGVSLIAAKIRAEALGIAT